jgi:hypothetical protein
MEIYKNDYHKEEDEALWEIHEIRHQLHKEFEKKSVDRINKESMEKYHEWKRMADKKTPSHGEAAVG